MAITHDDLGGDEDTARRVLVRARAIAPCISSFVKDSEEWKDALAILRGVIAELPDSGQARMKSLSRNGTSITLDTAIRSAFDGDATTNLRSLCDAQAASVPSGSLPVGSFPKARAFERVWPEGDYS